MGICQSIAGGDAVIVVDPPSPSPGKTNFCAECETSANDVEWNKNDVDKTTSSTTAATSVAGDNTTSFRFQTGTCALEYWEPLKLLGEGSISDIHLVRRRPARVKIPYKEECDIMTTAAGKITSQKTTTAKVSESKSDSGDTEQETYALKSIIKDHVRNDAFLEEIRNEIYTMSHLSHPNVVRVVEAYERKRHIYLIMEYCSGGDLCQVEGTGISEAKAAVIIKHILSAVGYLHENRVIHRDLKLENIMFADEHRRPEQIKIIDFGLATKYRSAECKYMTEKVGTIYTMAPQVLQGVYTSKCDLWSIGVITYILLSGHKPFWGPRKEMSWDKRRKIMVDRILRCEYTRMRFGVWNNISREAIQFVKSLLQCDPAARPSALEALQSPWMLKHFASEEVTADVTPSPSSGTVDTSEYDSQEANKGDEEQDLADETNTSIPGGKTDPSQTPKYKYDTHTKSVRSCASLSK